MSLTDDALVVELIDGRTPPTLPRQPFGAVDVAHEYAYNTYMNVTWDPSKAQANLRKHGVRFSDVEAVLMDPSAVTRDDPTAEGEQRFVSLGLDVVGRSNCERETPI